MLHIKSLYRKTQVISHIPDRDCKIQSILAHFQHYKIDITLYLVEKSARYVIAKLIGA